MDREHPIYRLHRKQKYHEIGADASSLLEHLGDENNKEAKATVLALLRSSPLGDIKAFIHDADILEEFDLLKEYGIDPAPLFNINSLKANTSKKIQELFETKDPDISEYLHSLSRHIELIAKEKLLGKNTGSKLAFFKNVTETSFSDFIRLSESDKKKIKDSFRPLLAEILRLLSVHKQRIQNPQKIRRIQEVINLIKTESVFLDLHALALSHPSCEWHLDEYCRIYADEIFQIFGSDENVLRTLGASDILSSKFYRTGKGIEVAYAGINGDFLNLGDTYGDCTAQEVRSQVDPEIANIGWTVYPWMLDPYYRVLETTVDGEGVLKGHITPMIVQDKTVLALDAIESVPKMRDVIKGRKNIFLSHRLFERRKEIIGALLEKVEEIGDRMGVDQVLVEKFSNATWVQDELDKFPPKFYHIDEVLKPFGTQAIRRVIFDILGTDASNIKEEIQLRNTNLWSQGLRQGYKEVGLLTGDDDGAIGILSGP